jgi:polyhydroxyalkanoate synthesis regulator phasin
MRNKKLAILLATSAIVAVGTGAAVGAIGSGDAKQEENAILADAAKQLETTPEALREALGDALDARLDQAVEDGRLTQEQADELKRRRQESGTVLGFGHRGPGGPHGRGHLEFRAGPGGGPLAGVADALGISERQLFRRLHSGRTLAQIAKAEGKDLADVKAAAIAAAKERLDEAVADGDLTQEQADERLEHLEEHLDELAENGFPARPRFHERGHGMPFPPGAPEAP